jgi:beta-galactosidase
MFDFGSGIRYEGDLRGVNTKGLVTFDRLVRKDPFYFYKANWSAEPVTHIVGRRYTDRAYARADVKVYSNADTLALTVNGKAVGSRSAAQCRQRTCVFDDVALQVGRNVIAARGTKGTEATTDEVIWTLSNAERVNIAAGQLATGLRASDGTRFGSDHFFSGGTGRKVVQPSRRGDGDTTPIKGVAGPADAELFATYREGRFKYDIPLANGTYRVVLGFVEPSKDMAVGERVFDVEVNGGKVLAGLDIIREAGSYRTVVTKTLSVTVSNGRLDLAFAPTAGAAVISNIAISRQ